ncbi:MAG: carbohydrate-binding module family 14 protein [Rikenellaceae bacterium]|nr:carbohydrate-binding module family 14 protein [Rikenellaceae bacterium]MCL2693365.1 carbohydrate-binding module family 14 protein [Rikenellaceae bacterium]
MRRFLLKFTPKTTLNKVNLALTGVFCLMLAGHIYMKASAEIASRLAPDPDDCRAYFSGGKRFCCPEGLVFCPDKNVCTWRWDPDCNFDHCRMPDPDEDPCVPD